MKSVWFVLPIVSVLFCGSGQFACTALPLSQTDATKCNADKDCAVPADCRSYSCASNGKCDFTFEPGKPTTCGPTCSTSDDCGGLPCKNGACGCNTDDDCGSTDCVSSACVNGQCVQHVEHPDDCRPSGDQTVGCSTTDDCAGMATEDPAPPCYVWTCVGTPGMCQKAPLAEGTSCASNAPICSGTCAFDSGGTIEVCKPNLPNCSDGGTSG